MSTFYAKKGKRFHPKYERPGRTKQDFIKDCDINQMLRKARKVGTLSHLEKHGAFYADITGAPQDLFEAREQLDRGKAIFGELSGELRREFNNDPLEYFAFVNHPDNKDRLAEVLPQIAEPGRYFPDVSSRTPPGALLEPSPAPVTAAQPSVDQPTAQPAIEASGGSEAASGDN